MYPFHSSGTRNSLLRHDTGEGKKKGILRIKTNKNNWLQFLYNLHFYFLCDTFFCGWQQNVKRILCLDKTNKITNTVLCRLHFYLLSYLSWAPFTLHVGPGKLPECLLCERKHVPGLIPGLIPGWGPSNIAGFSPGTSAVWTKAGSMP